MVAEFSGVNVVPIMIATYVICSVAAAIAGILYTGFVAQLYLGMGDPYLFASVAAVAIGGTPLIGGSGHYSGTIAGAGSASNRRGMPRQRDAIAPRAGAQAELGWRHCWRGALASACSSPRPRQVRRATGGVP